MSTERIAVFPKQGQVIPDRYRDADGYYTLDLYKKSDIGLTYQDDRDADGKIGTEGFNRMYHLTIPGGEASPKNELLLGYLSDENVFNNPVFMDGYMDAFVMDGTSIKLNGVLFITAYNRKSDKVDYKVMVVGKERNWVDILKSIPLNSLPYASVLFNDATVLSNIQTVNPKYSDTFRYYFAPIFHGRLRNQVYNDRTTYNAWVSEDMTILIYAKYIMDMIEDQLNGWKFVSQYIDSDYFLSKGVALIENFRQTEDDVKLNKFKLNRSTNASYTFIYNGEIEFNQELFDENDLHSISTKQTTIKKDGLYQFQFNVVFEIWSSKDVAIQDSNSTIKIKKNGVEIYSNTVPATGGGANAETYSHGQIVEFPLVAGDVITYFISGVVISWSGNLQPGEQPDWQSDLQGNSTLEVSLQKEIFDTTVSPGQFIDDRYSCWDFFHDMLIAGGCRLRTDYSLQQIIFDPPTQYYKPKSQAKDWTYKVSIHNEDNPLAKSARYFLLAFVNDSGDKYYNYTRAGGRVAIHDFEYDFLSDYSGHRFKGSRTIPMTMFAATRMMKVAENTDVPCITTNEIIGGDVDRLVNYYSIEEEAERTYKHSARLLHIEGWGNHNGASSWRLNDVDYTSYPMVWSEDRYGDITNEHDMTMKRIFETYWKILIQTLNLNGIKIMYAVLNSTDISEFNTQYLIKILHNYYYLKKIDNWLLNEPHLPTPIHLLLDNRNRII